MLIILFFYDVFLFRYGVPVVCTVVSTEGMFPENRKNILSVDDAKGFAEAVVELYTDPKLWQTVKEISYVNPNVYVVMIFRITV